MPYLLIQTNVHEDAVSHAHFVEAASKTVAAITGKPESRIMVALQTDIPMSFGGETGSCAFVHLKSLGLPEEDAPQYIAALSDLLHERMHIHPDRIFVQLSGHPYHLWGYNGVPVG